MNFEEWLDVTYISENDKMISGYMRMPKNKENVDILKSKTHWLDEDVSISARIRIFHQKVISAPLCPQCSASLPVLNHTSKNKLFPMYCNMACSNKFSHERKLKRKKELVENSKAKNLDDYIKKATYNDKFNSNWCSIERMKKHDVYEEYQERTKIIRTKFTLVQGLRFIKQSYKEHPKCVCDKLLNFSEQYARNNDTFNVQCSNSCEKANIIKTFKAQKTYFEKSGYTSPMKNPKIAKKIANLLKGKTKNISAEGKLSYQHHYWSVPTTEIMNDKDKFTTALKDCKNSLSLFSERYKVSHSTVLNYTRKYHLNHLIGAMSRFPKMSKPEIELFDWLDSITTNIKTSCRSVITPKELDIYLPDHKLAIEMNGVYWHSEKNQPDKNYHLNKTSECEEQGIHLLHIFDCEWNDEIRRECWKSLIKNKLGLSKRLYARKCSIIEIDNKTRNDFLRVNHLQGSDRASHSYGLYYLGELYAVMSFCKARFSKQYKYELSRFCCLNGYTIVGGAGKLLKHFMRRNEGSIVSYANRRWSVGGLYKALGFDHSHDSSPNYFYHQNSIYLQSRNKFQKHKLENFLDEYDSTITEWDNMKNNGYDRIWDSGNMVFILS